MELAGRWIAAVILLQIVLKQSALDFRKHHSLVSFWEVSVQRAMLYTQETDMHLVDSGMVTHPYSHDLRNEIVEELIPIEERKSFRTGR